MEDQKQEYKYEFATTKKFDKDFKRIEKRGYDIDLLNEVVDTLLADEPLADKHHDHNLTGNWKDHRECHITPNWLLIYLKDETTLVLTATRTGTHSDLLGM